MPGFVPESVLKKRATAEKVKAAKDAMAATAAKKADTNKAEMIKRAETYVKEYQTLENDSIRLRREAKASGSYYVPPDAKLAFVVRIRGASPTSWKTALCPTRESPLVDALGLAVRQR